MRRLVALAAFAILSTTLVSPARAQPVSLTIELAEWRLTPDNLEVSLGEEVEIRVFNNGTEAHTFVLEGFANYDSPISPRTNVTVHFNAETRGTYAMYCVLPGHRAAGMEGTFTISRTVAPPPAPVLEVVGLLAASALVTVAVVVVLLRTRREPKT